MPKKGSGGKSGGNGKGGWSGSQKGGGARGTPLSRRPPRQPGR